MEIGRYYQRSGKWLAADMRFRNVVDNYQTTSHAPEALYPPGGELSLARHPGGGEKAAAVLGTNYPGSEWYERAYKLMNQHAEGVKAS